MPTAVTFNSNTIKGVTLEGVEIPAYILQFHDRKFWGVQGVSRIFGQHALRPIRVPVLIYDEDGEDGDFAAASDLSDYIANELNGTLVGTNGDLAITSPASYPTLSDCTMEGADLIDGPKLDDAGTLTGGSGSGVGYWAIALLHFTQLN